MRFLLAIAVFFLASPVQAEPFYIPEETIVRVDCGRHMGTAVNVGEDAYVSAAHVVSSTGSCKINGEEIRNVKNHGNDFSTFRGPSSPVYAAMSCGGFTYKRQYLAVGYGNAFYEPMFQPWIASAVTKRNFRHFIGEAIPGMSGGPVISYDGKVVGIVNMRWPARSVALADTPVCKEKNAWL